MNYKAYAFARPGGAIIAGFPEGHAAFGFQLDDSGTFLVGGVELGGAGTSHVDNQMNFWTARTTDPLSFMSAEVPHGRRTRYDMAKMLLVEDPKIAAAIREIERIEGCDYNLLSQNCRTDTVQVLEAFGVTGLPGGSRPGGFFGGIDAPIIPLTAPWPGLKLDVSLYDQTDQYGIRSDIDAGADGTVSDPSADQRKDGIDGPLPNIASIMLRRGYMALYPDHDFEGEPVVISTAVLFNCGQAPWPDKAIRSWYASEAPFDAHAIKDP